MFIAVYGEEQEWQSHPSYPYHTFASFASKTSANLTDNTLWNSLG